MITKDLINYIKTATERGVTKEKIAELLLKAGWPASDIEEGFRTVIGQPTEKPQQELPPPENRVLLSSYSQDEKPKTKRAISIKNLIIDVVIIIIAVGLTYVFGDKINALIKSYTQKEPDPAVIFSTTSQPISATSTPVEDNKHDAVDFIVSDISVMPNPPVVNSPETQIFVTIKNIGSTSSETVGVSAIVEMTNSNLSPFRGGIPAKIRAGETATWIIRPYASVSDTSSKLQKTPDTPGFKTVKVILNPDKTALELNYSNNIFTKEFNFVK